MEKTEGGDKVKNSVMFFLFSCVCSGAIVLSCVMPDLLGAAYKRWAMPKEKNQRRSRGEHWVWESESEMCKRKDVGT